MQVTRETSYIPTLTCDIVVCLDVSYSMRNRLGDIKKLITEFAGDLGRFAENYGVEVPQTRTKVITFADSREDPESLQASPFFVTSETKGARKLDTYLEHIEARDNQRAIHRSGLEALSVAMASDWVQEGDRQRHIIVMFTDASAHRLEDRVGNIPTPYAAQIPTSLDELTNIWEGDHNQSRITTGLKRNSQRLMLFAPDTYPWPTIGDNWSQTLFLSSEAGEGLAEVEYDTILEVLANSV